MHGPVGCWHPGHALPRMQPWAQLGTYCSATTPHFFECRIVRSVALFKSSRLAPVHRRFPSHICMVQVCSSVRPLLFDAAVPCSGCLRWDIDRSNPEQDLLNMHLRCVATHDVRWTLWASARADGERMHCREKTACNVATMAASDSVQRIGTDLKRCGSQDPLL